jgi:cellulose biosynthesis protein BcsQ
LSYTVELVQQSLNPKLEIGGIIFCQFNGQTKLSNEVVSEVTEHFGEKVFETKIRKNVKLAESPSHCQPTVHYDSTCAGVEDYRSLAIEFLRKGGEEVSLPEPEYEEEYEDAPEAPQETDTTEEQELPANIRFVE